MNNFNWNNLSKSQKWGLIFGLVNIVFMLLTSQSTNDFVGLYMMASLPVTFLYFIIAMNIGQDVFVLLMLLTTIYWYFIGRFIGWCFMKKEVKEDPRLKI